MSKLTTLPRLSLRRLTTLALLLGLAYVIGRFSITIIPRQLVLSFTFIANSLIGALMGPWASVITFGLFDIFETLLSEKAGLFLIGWTLMEAFIGFWYGFFFYGKKLSWASKKDWLHVTLAYLVIVGFEAFILTPLLIQHYYQVPFWAQMLAGRWLKIFEIPFRVVVTMAILPQLQRIREWRQLTDS